MRSSLVVIFLVGIEQMAQMPFAEHDNMVKTIPWLIDRRSSAEAPHPLLRAALENCAAGRAKVATVMRHAGADTLNVRDILVAEPHRVWFASRALLRGPLLRSCGQRRACERET